MAARSSSRRPFAWTEKNLHEDVLPDKRRLAMTLQEICRHLVIKSADGVTLTHPTQAQAAEHLKISETSLTRYLKGQYVPAAQVTASLFDTARRDAGDGRSLGITREKLLELRAQAEQERCGNCARHREAVRVAGQKLKAARETQERLEQTAEERDAQLRALRQHASVLKKEAQRARSIQPGAEAGLQKGRRAAQSATLLPVPRRRGDRQQSGNEVAAAQRITRRAEELLRGGRPDSILALLRHTVEAYTSVEIALLVSLLRTSGQHQLVGNLVHIYGRDRSDRDVVRAALILHEQDAVADAEALLRSAAARPGSTPPHSDQPRPLK
ncbi:hypothetical protein GCM10010294_01400 [Streptomyces griseoloalbus]|uniref:hypothetical protein n=1 Tax=Streptomyces griseoloalbus TaxID=67303 RepID=UPI001874F7E5|nr:hypothetical protein GCM10010294_01400 [Streptomyces griseoloalbus]